MELMKSLFCISIQIILIANLNACNNILSIPNNITELDLPTKYNTETLEATSTLTKTYEKIRNLTVTKTNTQTNTPTKLYIPSKKDLNRSVWYATLHLGVNKLSYIFAFYEDGRLDVMDRIGHITNNNSWTIIRYLLILNIDDGTSIYEGKFLDKDNIVGTGKSEDGETWTWEPHRENLGWNFGI